MKTGTVYRVFVGILLVTGFMVLGCDPGNSPSGGVTSTDITFTASQLGGASGTADSSGIKFVFSSDVTDLSAADITVANDTGVVTKGALSGGNRNWTVALSSVASEGNVKVSVNKTGVQEGVKNVAVYKNTSGPYNGLVSHYLDIEWQYDVDLNVNKGVYIQGPSVLATINGDIMDRFNDVDVWIKVGSISANYITLTFPPVEDGILVSQSGIRAGRYDNWKTETYEFDLMDLSTQSFAIFYYANADCDNFNINGDTVSLKKGWNIVKESIGGQDHEIVADLQTLYSQGFRWYVDP